MSSSKSTDQSYEKPETHEARVSYGFGWQFGRQMHQNNFEGLDVEVVVQAIRQCFAGEKSMLDENELNEAYDAIKEKRKAVEQKRREDYKELCATFLSENAKRDGVIVTESGLQYEVLEQGDGPLPTIDNVVRTHYHGSFIDGQVFDSSVTRNEPAEFEVNQVIPGWTEILLMMPVGSKYRIAVPYQLAYGEAGSAPSIPGFATLMFEIHLMDIVR